MPRWQKPANPGAINLGDPLARQLLFALAPGWDRGLRSSDSTVTPEARTEIAGVLQNVAIAGGVAQTSAPGWGLCSGSNSWFNYPSDIGIPSFVGNVGFSVAILVEPLVIPALNTVNRRVFQKRLNGAPTSPGFDMFLDSFIAYTWSFEWADGVTEQTLRSVNQIPTLNRPDLLVGTLNPQTSIANLYVNGILENSAALVTVPSNPVGQPIGVCGGIGPANDAGGDNCATFAALWNRELSQQDVLTLHANPFRMFTGNR